MSDGYKKRTVDPYINEYIESMGALLIEGPKWCGKTRTAEEFVKSALYIKGKNQIASLKLAFANDIMDPLDGDTPRLIDEWQMVPEVWDAVRFEVDHRRKRGQFILTGSSTPSKGSVAHSGAGRIASITMRPMSLFESGESNGRISLKDLFNGEQKIGCSSQLKVDGLARALTRGGWPESIGDHPDRASRIAQQYVKAIVNSDLSDEENDVKRNPIYVKRLIESISRNISTAASKETIRKDINSVDGTMSEVTLTSYIRALEKIFMIENLPAWNPHMRSRTRLMKTPKWHFVDPSIATAALRVTHDALLNDYDAFGLFFESLCIRDLRVYSQPLDGSVSYIGDSNGKEVDMIVELPGGKWGAIEVKLGENRADEGAKNLLRLRDNIDEEYMKQPSFLMVLTGGQLAYKRPDGVLVVPIGCLKD